MLSALSKYFDNFALSYLVKDKINDLVTIINELINVTTPGYVREGKKYVTVAIGCTGGKHRSVTIAEKVAQELKSNGA